jgi:peptidoglycan/xylan/chitin deacetylase (PgdA/CDA1 family)
MKTYLKAQLAKLLWRTGLIALAGMLRRVIQGPRLIILCYHRIDNNTSLPALSASPVDFTAQVNWFARRFKILTLDEVSGYLKNRLALNRDCLALTFDDGYADNYTIVVPVLTRLKLPVAFFISSDPLLRRIPYWYDTLWSRLSNWTGRELTISDQNVLPDTLKAALTLAAKNPEKPNLQKVLNLAKGLGYAERKHLMDGLEKVQRLGVMDPLCETMTIQEARHAVALGVIMGSHTRSHPSLARVPAKECQDEIVSGWQDLSENGFSPRYFAYPFGESVDIGGFEGHPRQVLLEIQNTKSKDGSKLEGVELALTTEERAVRPGDDPLLVPRKVISPQTLAQIALKLELLAWRK